MKSHQFYNRSLTLCPSFAPLSLLYPFSSIHLLVERVVIMQYPSPPSPNPTLGDLFTSDASPTCSAIARLPY